VFDILPPVPMTFAEACILKKTNLQTYNIKEFHANHKPDSLPFCTQNVNNSAVMETIKTTLQPKECD